jgi:hypothetical protein
MDFRESDEAIEVQDRYTSGVAAGAAVISKKE